jgi:hypothetical protein
MKTLFGFGTVTALAMAAVACSSPEVATPSSSSLEVTGTVDTALRSLDNASAVAIGSDGRTFSAYVQKNGSFKLDLPVGHTYRILIANSTMAGELRTIGHLVNKTSDGKTDEIAVKEGGKMKLGALRPAGTSAGSVKTACDCDDDFGGKPQPDKGDWDDADDSAPDPKSPKGEPTDPKDKGDVDDDYQSKPKDGDKDRICEDAADVELEAENGPGDKCKKGAGDKPAPKPTKKSCSTPDADKDGKDDGAPGDKAGGGKGGSGDADESLPGKKPADEGDYGGKGEDKGGSAGGGTSSSPAGSCTCSLQCGKGSSCFASKCVADDAPVSKPAPKK